MNRLGKGGFIMKTRSIFMISLAFAAMSCAKEVLPETNPEENTELNLVPMEFTTSLETKASIVDGQSTVEWKAEDAITVFDELGGRNKFTTSTGGRISTFTGTVTAGAAEFYALYPERSSAAEFAPATKKITSKLFPDQTAVLGSYAIGNGGAVMVAKADENNLLSFKNMTSHIRFTLAEDLTDVKSITLMGNNGEALAGLYEIDCSAAEPMITVTKPETYVTLSKGNEALVPGDYFFTVLPVEFTNGFTVILSKTDGSQVAKKTTKAITSLNKRNQILPMAKLASTDYKSHMNYFVKYNDGFDLTFGGYTFNKETHSGATLVNGTYANGTITKDGLYFIDSSYESAILNKNAFGSLIIVGVDEAKRTKFTLGRPVQPTEGGTVILLANLDCKVRKNDDSAINAFNQPSTNPFSKFGTIVGYNSHFRNIASNFIEFKRAAVNNLDVHLEDCEFGFNGSEVYLFNVGSQESDAQKFTFKNNVCYAEEGTTMTKFKLIHSDNLSVENLNIDKNTYVGTVIETNLLRVGDISSTLDFARNLFVECSAAEVKLINLKIGTNKANVTGVATNNYYYTSAENAAIGLGVGKSALTSMTTINSTAVLSVSPLGTDWAPARGTFGPYNYGEDVSNTVGAWRSDMKEKAETANAAAVNYASVNLGNL